MIIGVSGKIGSGKDTIANIIQYLTSDLRHKMSFEEYKKYTRHTIWQNKKFADKIKDITCMLIGCTRVDLEDSVFKNKELDEEWDMYELNWSDGWDSRKDIVSKDFDKSKFLDKKGQFYGSLGKRIPMTPRLLMQLLGTDCGRNIIHPNIWVNSLMSEYYKQELKNYYDVRSNIDYPNWIISDVRFPNELKAIETRDGICIRVIRPSMQSSNGACKQKCEDYPNCKPCGDIKEEHESETALDNASFHYTILNDGSIDKLITNVEIILTEIGII